ncbi:hypothetical protein ACHBTE_04245 [Streptomyces sp. M41]|uniref:hypothetical protein n=1 Tax=Streptomyces sp. M41 TaxID=3059412 RepID=UPI00374D021A
MATQGLIGWERHRGWSAGGDTDTRRPAPPPFGGHPPFEAPAAQATAAQVIR